MLLNKLTDIVTKLRGPGGCPWDQEQTFKSLKPHIIEESYELVDAIDQSDMTLIKEELGDVLLHVVMLSKMAEEFNEFCLADVIENVCQKMIERHPHVFANTSVKNSDEVKKNWELIKQKGKTKSMMSGIAKSLPSLKQAYDIQKKAASVGFDWPDVKGPLDKIHEEAIELKKEVQLKSDCIEEEAGDLLFAMVNLYRKLGLDAEECLRQANKKFMNRFEKMTAIAKEKKQIFSDLSLAEKELLWTECKKNV